MNARFQIIFWLTPNYLDSVLAKFDLNAATADPKRHWFPYALRSVAMMHSVLAMAAVLWRAENAALDRLIQLEGMRQKYEAIREVRAQLPRHAGVGRKESSLAYLMSTMSTLVFVEVRGDILSINLKAPFIVLVL